MWFQLYYYKIYMKVDKRCMIKEGLAYNRFYKEITNKFILIQIER